MSDWRYFATKLNGDGTETLIADDLPLQDVDLELELSGPGGLRASLAPELAALKGPDGQPILKAWSTALYAEKDGLIRGGGILVDVAVDGAVLELDAVGFSDYAKGMPYTGDYSKIQVDPLDVVRHIWEHLQTATKGNLGLTVDDTTTDVLIGTPETPALTAAKTKEAAAKTSLEAAADLREAADADLKGAQAAEQTALYRVFDAIPLEFFPDKGAKILSQASAPSGSSASVYNLWRDTDAGNRFHVYRLSPKKGWVAATLAASNVANDRYAEWLDAKAVTETRKEALKQAKATESTRKTAYNNAVSARKDLREGEAVPYRLVWWETDDLGQAIDDLAASTPFDYRVLHGGDPDTQITHRLELGYPRLGRRLHELSFIEGVNITQTPSLTYGDDYADEVVVLGAGEGRAMVRGTWSKPTDRLRRVAVVESKGTRHKDAATKLAEQEVKLRAPEPEIDDSIEVLDHPNAPIGTYAPGDEILVTTADGWTGEHRVWYRILSVTIHPSSNTATLSLERAEKGA
jgi:hypothetical protein